MGSKAMALPGVIVGGSQERIDDFDIKVINFSITFKVENH